MPIPATQHLTPTGKKSIIYHTSWSNYGRNYQIKDLPIDEISDIAYAFFNINAEQGIFTGDSWADFENPYIDKGVDPQNTWSSPSSDLGNFGQFHKLRKQGKQFNLQLAIGGWTWSTYFSDVMATESSRQTAVASIVKLFENWPELFNGISIDWEYLSNDGKNYGKEGNHVSLQDPENFIEFLKLLRTSLGDGFTIAFCVSAAPEKMKMPIDMIHPLIDELHVMTYDFHDGNFNETIAMHHTNLRQSSYGKYSVEEATAAYLGYGVPSTKIFIGAPFYSRGYGNSDGIGKPASGGSPDKSWENGVVDVKALPLDGATEIWDDEARAAYSYDSNRRVLNSYDNVQSVKEKSQFVHDNNLGGIICWESSGDYPAGSPKSLIKALHNYLTHGKPTDLIPQPQVIPTPPGGTFTPNRRGGIISSPDAISVPGSCYGPTPTQLPTPTNYCARCTTCNKTNCSPCEAHIDTASRASLFRAPNATERE